MKSVDLAISGVKRAARWLQGARRALDDKRWDDVVFSSQMAVELSAKAILLSLGIEFPSEHDVGGIFIQLADRDDLPRWFRTETKHVSNIISELAKLRGMAGYGFDKASDPNYFRDYAPEALRSAERVYEACVRLLNNLFGLSLKIGEIK